MTFPNAKFTASEYLDYYVLTAISIKIYIDHKAKNAPVNNNPRPIAIPQS